MARLETIVDPASPRTMRADVADVGEVFLAGPNRIPVMRTARPGCGSPKTYEFVALGNVANVLPGTLLYYEGTTEMFMVETASLVIKR